MHNIFLISSIFGPNVFFVIMALMGLTYNNIDNSNSYILYNIFIMTFCTVYFFIDVLRKKRSIKLILFIFPFIIIFNFFLNSLFYETTSTSIAFFSYFIIWSIPAFFIGIYYSWNDRYLKLLKSLDLVMILGSIATLISVFSNFLQGNYSEGIGGATNQTLAYISAFVFGLNLFLTYTTLNFSRFKFVNNRLYKFLCVLLLPLQFLSVTIVGGRGAMILIFVYVLLFIIGFIKRRKDVKVGLFLISFFIMFTLLLPFSSNEIVINGYERTFSYIGEDSINWDATSNRDTLYKEVIQYIKEEPLMGYGLFSYFSYIGNPHNIILEVLLSGGVLYLLVFIIIAAILTKKYLSILKKNSDMIMIGVIGVFPFTMLLFSGSYLTSPEIWFFLGFVLSMDLNVKEELKY